MMERKKYQLRTETLLAVFLVFISSLLFNCNNDDNNDDQYYVKYEVNSTTIYSGGSLNVIVNDVQNQKSTFSIATKKPWEVTIGPVNKGFETSLSVSEIGNNYGHLRMQAKISVSKNNGPFAVKRNDDSTEPRTSVQTSYKIDF